MKLDKKERGKRERERELASKPASSQKQHRGNSGATPLNDDDDKR